MATKLTEDQVLEIYQGFLYGEDLHSLAKQYDVHWATVSDIVRGKTWKNITGYRTCSTLEELANGKPFLPIPGHPNNYITIDGAVMSKIHGHTHLRVISTNEHGYKCCYITAPGRSRSEYTIHRLLCLTYKADSYFEGAEVRHLDGNQANNNLDNLKWGTHQENMSDKIRHGTSLRGEQQINSKLAETDVHDIRVMLNQGLSQKEIAAYFHVARTTISGIANGYNWGWLPYRSLPADNLSTPIAKPKLWKKIGNTPSRPIQSSHVTVIVTRNHRVGSLNRW